MSAHNQESPLRRLDSKPNVAIVGYPWLIRDHTRLLEACTHLGLSGEIWNPENLSIDTRPGSNVPMNNGSHADAQIVIPRGVNRVFPFVSQWMKLMDKRGSVFPNSIESCEKSIDKLRTSIALVDEEIAVVPSSVALLTGFVPQYDGALVVKPAFGSGGLGIHSFPSADDPRIRGIANLSRNPDIPLYQHFLLQPMATGAGTDHRVVILNGRSIAATTRRARTGSFITNGPNANVEAGAPTGAITLAEQAAHALGLRFAGVDVIRNDDGFAVLDVNCWPGISMTEEVTSVDIASALIESLVQDFRVAHSQS
jgi:glutathione synthase/RimK-type ligase-like ATP-grasp enzyme